jgi:thiamine biosynthesis lipoprotein
MDEAAHVARKFSALVDMGYERVNASPVATETARIDRKTHKVTSSRAAMGTLVSISTLARSQDLAEEAIGRAFVEMDRLIGVFSRFDGASAVSELNDAGRLQGAPPEFSHVLSQSLLYHELTGGAFDVSVEPVVDLFRRSPESSLPADRDVLEALELVGSRRIAFSRDTIDFERSGMRVTVDGIAKGYIVDAIAAVLETHKIKSYLIDGGGDVRASGTKEKRRPWTVAVQDPSKQGDFPDTIHLTNGAVATSGSYEVYFDREQQHHHIVNSKTGKSPIFSQSVSVIAPSTMAADALATTAFVMDPDEGVEFISGLPGCECLIVDRDGLQLKTRGWKSVAPVH